MSWNNLAAQHHTWVEQMGWHNISVLESLALIASEIGEAAEACLENRIPSPFGEELADIVLRTANLAHSHNIDLDSFLDEVEVTWRSHNVREDFLELMQEMSKWVNTARGDTLDASFREAMGRVFKRVVIMAECVNVDLEAEVRRKMSINAARGTRGRRV